MKERIGRAVTVSAVRVALSALALFGCASAAADWETAGMLMAAGAHHWQRVVAQERLGGVLARGEPEPCDL